MENAGPSAKNIFSTSLIFMAGFLVGAMLLFGIGHVYLKSYIAVKAGRFLDQDMAELKNGDVIKGHLTEIKGNKYYVEMKSGSMVLNANEVKSVTKNINARYLKELW